MDLLKSSSYLALTKAFNRQPGFYVKRLRWGGSGIEYLDVIVYGERSIEGRGIPCATTFASAELLKEEEPDTVAELLSPILQDALNDLVASSFAT